MSTANKIIRQADSDSDSDSCEIFDMKKRKDLKKSLPSSSCKFYLLPTNINIFGNVQISETKHLGCCRRRKTTLYLPTGLRILRFTILNTAVISVKKLAIPELCQAKIFYY